MEPLLADVDSGGNSEKDFLPLYPEAFHGFFRVIRKLTTGMYDKASRRA
jgi:hypothetical protein